MLSRVPLHCPEFDTPVIVNVIEGDDVASTVQPCTIDECPCEPYVIINIVVPSVCKGDCHPTCGGETKPKNPDEGDGGGFQAKSSPLRDGGPALWPSHHHGLR